MVALDVALAERITEGDEEAFTYFFQRYRGEIQRHIARIIGDYFEAEDLTQEVFLRAYNSIGTYSGSASLGRWLRKIATNMCIDRLRKKRIPVVSWPTTRGKDGDEELLEIPDDQPLPSCEVESKDEEESIMKAITCLPPYYRDVVILHDVMHYSRNEIAEKLSCPLGTVKSRLSRAHALLARLLGEKKSLENLPVTGVNILVREMVAG